MAGKTHIMKDKQFTYCSQIGSGPHATVYAVKGEEVIESVIESTLGRSLMCQRCTRAFRRRLTLSPVMRASAALVGQDLAAGGAQEPRSAPSPALPTPFSHPALRIDLRAGIVDLRSVPLHLLYAEDRGQMDGEYRRALNMSIEAGWAWSTSQCSGFLVVTRLEVTGGAL